MPGSCGFSGESVSTVWNPFPSMYGPWVSSWPVSGGGGGVGMGPGDGMGGRGWPALRAQAVREEGTLRQCKRILNTPEGQQETAPLKTLVLFDGPFIQQFPWYHVADQHVRLAVHSAQQSCGVDAGGDGPMEPWSTVRESRGFHVQ